MRVPQDKAPPRKTYRLGAGQSAIMATTTNSGRWNNEHVARKRSQLQCAF